MNLDHLFMAAAALSGGLWVYYGVMRFGAEEERRKPALFWRDIFLMTLAILALRFFFWAFPGLRPDHFFLTLVAASGALWAFFFLSKRPAAAFWRDMFVCFFLVFVVRGFFVDYFRIPSNSMLPTLIVGDVVLTDKNAYGYRLPFLGWRLTDGTPPERGEVAVFRKPDEDLFFIKRIMAIPGDEVRMQAGGGEVSINGKALTLQEVAGESTIARLALREQMPSGGWHNVYKDRHYTGLLFRSPDKNACELQEDTTLICRVPEGSYFVLGDNRNHSNDSRYWGFVGQDDMVGPAFRILFNYKTFTGRWWLPLALEE